VVEKQSRFVRFHAFQSLLFHGAMIVLSIGIQILNIVLAVLHLGIVSLLIGLVGMVFGLGMLALTIFLMVKAYGNEEFMVPVIGEMAKKWA